MSELPPIEFLFRLAEAASAETLPRFRQKLAIESKLKAGYRFDPVTEADREAERVIRELISSEFPDHAILGEEFGSSGDGPIKWVIDPVDGTRPFICGIPVWGTLIGLTVDGVARLGMMSQPYTRETFWADSSGSWMDIPTGRHPLRSSTTETLSDAILHVNSPEPFKGSLKEKLGVLDSVVRMTRYGGECYAFAMLAAGQIDLCVETGIQPYDIVALIPIIENAGGVVTTTTGGRAEQGGDILISGNRFLHEAALKILKT